jgi:diguanylate cyclase (GGDEF)-like protein
MIHNHVIATAGRPLSSMFLAPLRLTLPCLIVAALCWLAIGSSVASAASQPVTEGWEYRWGDSPIDANGVPTWTETSALDQWSAIDFPSNPPDRNGRNNVWYRVTLPAGHWHDPMLYIFSVDLIVQVWQGDRQIYQFGEFDAEGRGEFAGWPWHAIALPPDYHDKPLYFRIYSNYIDIGLWGKVAVMEQQALVPYILKNSIKSLIVAGMCALLALLAAVFAFVRKDDQGFIGIALFASSSALLLLAGTDASQLLWHQPLVWEYLEAGSYYMVPVALGVMLTQWRGTRPARLLRRLWQLHLLYLVLAQGASLLGLVTLASTYPVFDGLFLVSLIIMSVMALFDIRQMSGEQRLLLAVFGVYCLLLIADMAVAHGFLPWVRVPVSWGVLLFLLAVVSISVTHYRQIQIQLQQMNARLEQEVAERTAKAEALTLRERRRVKLLTFENEKNHLSDAVVAGLQRCVSLTQAMELLVLELPDLTSPLRGVLYQPDALCTYLPEDCWRQVVSWGYNSNPSSPLTNSSTLPKTFDGLINLPPPTRLFADIRDLPSDDTDLPAALHNLCLWINVQKAESGIHTIGLLQLEVPEYFSANTTEYGIARLYFSMDQIIQKIGLTLSGVLLQDDLQKFSYEDALTGLHNRRFFDRLIKHERAVCLRSQRPLTLLIADVDHFKRFNDDYGHEVGDLVLQRIASELAPAFRESDVVCRYGGEEFVIIMAGASSAQAKAKATGLCERVQSLRLEHEGVALRPLTISVGVANWPDSTLDPEKLMGLADKALYRAKRNGRNRVEVSSSG